MKILLVQETDWMERGPHQQHHLMERLSLESHEIRVIDYELLWRTKGNKRLFSRREIFDDYYKIFEDAEITVVRPGKMNIPYVDNASILFSHQIEINRQLEEFKPDIIIGFGILNTYLAMRAAKKHNIPFAYYVLDKLHTLVPYKFSQPVAKTIEKKVLKDADISIVLNDELKDYAVGMGAVAESTYVVRAGVDLERFNPDVDGNVVRKEYGVTKDDIVMFFMGWIYDFSGMREVAQSLAQLKTANPNLKLMIVGEGDLYEELKQIRDKNNLQDQLILTGQQPFERIPDFIAASTICLLPAYNNPIMRDIVPIKMYEYLAMGKPVVATKLPGVMREFGNDSGIVYVDHSEQAVQRVLELDRDDVLPELGLKARKFVEKQSWSDVTREFEEILEQTVEDFCDPKSLSAEKFS